MKRFFTSFRAAAMAALLLTTALPTANAQGPSLWRDDGKYANFVTNNTARRAGDTLTIVIAEAAAVTNSEQTKTDRSGSLQAQLTAFDIAPEAFNTLPTLGGSHAQKFDGKADQTKQNRFETRVQVVVQDVLPNGTLVVVGRRTITVDDETKTIEIRGVVRREDITAQNTVKSEQVANASISYVGSGPLTRTTTKGAVATVFEFIFHLLWPF